jgi:alginate O-acetyltransferase complex protein AlgI
MLFDSFPFWAFLLAVWIIWRVRSDLRYQKAALLIASYLFYAAWRPAYAIPLLVITVFSYVCGRLILAAEHPARRRRMLATGVLPCLGLLVYFKYGNFLSATAGEIWALMTHHQWELSSIVLPVGISFYSFQAIAYLIDCYRGHVEKPAGLLDLSLYLSFFPHLIAGPILRADNFLPQLEKRLAATWPMLWQALVLISFGLFKKLVLADNLALVSGATLAPPGANGARLLLSTYAYAAQIYCDFSGYSDIAIGVALLFGLRLPKNFDWPYLALNPPDFWRRWHITLSNWLRDYIYFSLPGLRSKWKGAAHVNMIVTMIVCGLWHGPTWGFLLWGFYHGCLLVGYRLIKPRIAGYATGPRWAREIGSIFLMQQFAVAGWILFRANHFSEISAWIRNLAQPGFIPSSGFTGQEVLALWLLAAVFVFHAMEWRIPLTKAMLGKSWNPWILILLLLMAMAGVILRIPYPAPFLYFRF